MAIENIDRAIYTVGKNTDFDAGVRSVLLGRFGIPRQKIVTEHREELLTSARQTAELLSGRLDEAPDALDLLVFSGRVDDGWKTLVAKAYEAIGRKAGHANLELHLVALDEIFRQIGAVRAAFSKSRQFDPEKATKQIQHSVPVLPATLMDAVKKRVMLLMLSDGEDFVREGQLATHLGVIDGAFGSLQTISDPQPVIRHLEECVWRRGL
ncbi:hypothetical protein HYW83_03490 [Candidatus Peregrinibacteria bacterium]|nr:hypothetical protein [Candidatus Peregrinibacteria bacterium]